MPKQANAKKPNAKETMDEYINRRAKEILGSGGFDWQDFTPLEKMIAAIQAKEEYINAKAN